LACGCMISSICFKFSLKANYTYRLNFVLLTLISKENKATTANKFRPIDLLN
jgi:hypothetical protein